MRLAAALSVALLAGCPSGVVTGIYGKSQAGYGLGTVQHCVRNAEAVAAFDRLAPIVVDELHRAGLCKDAEDVLDGLHGWCGSRIAVCIIDQPEPCQRHGKHVAGCAGSGWFMVSTWSPPLCGPGVEVKCVATHAEQRDTMWRTFAHEAVELLLTRCGHYADSHSPAARSAELRVWERWRGQ